MKRVFIAGPYTKGDVAINVKNAMFAASVIIDMGYAPFIPHLYHFQHMAYAQEYTKWCDIDIAFLSSCHAVFLLPGKSNGAEAEVIKAHELGIPVFRVYDHLDTYLNELR